MMNNKILGLLLMFVLVIASCTEDVDIPDPCATNDTGDLTVVNQTSGSDAVPLRIKINGNDTTVELAPGAEFYAGALEPGSYEIEGTSGTVQFIKTVTLLQCDDLFVSLGN
jgi:hypothetical protein